MADTTTQDRPTDDVEAEQPDETPTEATEGEEQADLDTLAAEAKSRGEVVLRSREPQGGMLSIDPAQTDLTPAQVIGFRSIGIETDQTVEGAVPLPHVWAFVHLCQTRGLDPWLREAYLITHGRKWYSDRDNEWVDNRKFTLVTGIDGFRSKGERTGKYAGMTPPEWSDENGVWHEFWLARWGQPVAARVGVLRHGFDGPVYGLAMYDEFVPMVDEYEGQGRQRRKTGDQVPTPMWQKMPANQLAKCAEAQAWRKAFPRDFGGMYEPAEMDRAVAEYEQDQDQHKRVEGAQRRATAHQQRPTGAERAKAREPRQPATREVIEGIVVADEKAPDNGPTAADPQADISPEQALHLARTEARWQAERMLRQSIEQCARRAMSAAGVTSPADLTAEQVLRQVCLPVRGHIAGMLAQQGMDVAASAYGHYADKAVYVDVPALLGYPDADALFAPLDANEPHQFQQSEQAGRCRCGLDENEPQHV